MISDNEFIKWVEDKRSEGYSDESIIELLSSKGYSKRYIKLVKNPYSTTSKIDISRISSIFRIVFIIILISFLFFILINAVVHKQPNPEENKNRIENINQDLIYTQDFSSCYDLGDGGKEDCFMDCIRNNPSIASAELCNSMRSTNYANTCRFFVATESSYLDKDTCDSLGGYKPLCYQHLAQIRGDSIYCEYAADPTACIKLVASKA